MERVHAFCYVDDLGKMMYAVEVWGNPPHDHRRSYTLKATSEDTAAQQGLRMFEDEMMALHDEGQDD